MKEQSPNPFPKIFLKIMNNNKSEKHFIDIILFLLQYTNDHYL